MLRSLFGEVAPLLCSSLRRAFRNVPDGAIEDAVEDAVVQYALRPSSFDPARGVPLERFLYQASRCNLLNTLAADRRRRDREAIFAERMSQPLSVPTDEREIDELKARLLGLASNERERAALLVWLEGEGGHESIVRGLAIADLPLAEQRLEVKRFKSRVLRRFDRLRSKGDLQL